MKDNTIKSEKKQYHHLTKEDRIKIETLINIKDENGKRIYSNSYIAKDLGVHKSTIGRELKNRIKSKINVRSGKIKNIPYNATDAQNNYMFKRGLSKGEYKLRKFPKMTKYIEDKILSDGWAPDVVVGYMKRHNMFNLEGYCEITTPTIYNAIRLRIIKVKIEDTRRMKEHTKYEHHEKKSLPENKLDYSIEKRPEEIDKRLEFGHFELDTVVGKRDGKHECLMTLTDRKTRFEMIFKLSGKTAEEVVYKFNKIKDFLKRYFDKVFKSLTTDNGSEFSDFLSIIENTKANIYFCHPYCSGEKGTNERHNEIVRYFIPKGELIENYSYDDINKIADWMNNYPRKILDYRTPLEAVMEEINDVKILNKLYKIQAKINAG